MPSDEVYQETKLVMLGKAVIKPEFRPLADWIDITYGVSTINIFYDTIDQGRRPRLEICFEYDNDRTQFSNSSGFDAVKQQSIAGKFAEIIQELRAVRDIALTGDANELLDEYVTDNVWVIYGAFEPIAKIDTTLSISREHVEELKASLNNPDLWEISLAFTAATFFLYTDGNVKAYEHDAVRVEWTNKFFDLLKQYDTFKYFSRDQYTIYLDSKENFDKNYNSNWYYYYK